MSTNYTRCIVCKGSKTLMGLGMIVKDCPECAGIGWKDYQKSNDPIFDNDLTSDISEKLTDKPEHPMLLEEPTTCIPFDMPLMIKKPRGRPRKQL